MPPNFDARRDDAVEARYRILERGLLMPTRAPRIARDSAR